MAMEFWGEEVRPGTTVSCEVTEGYVIHLSQAALGETKKGSENVVVSIKVDGKKLVLGTLSLEKHPQIMCDLIFDKCFELSHSSKTASVFLCGYKSEIPADFESDSGEDEEPETIEIPVQNNQIKLSAGKVPMNDDKKDKQDADEEMSSGDDDFSDDSDDIDMSEDESSDEDEVSSGADPSDDSEDGSDDSDPSDDSEDGTDDSEEEQTPTPKKLEVVGKKRVIEPETPSGKKAKTEQSGQKTGDKKGSHVSPHPAKQASKTPAADKKSKEKSPKSGSHACKSCNKTFGSEPALEFHQKAKKHEA